MATVRVTTADDTFEFLDATYEEGMDLKVHRPDGRLWSHFPKGSYTLEVVEPMAPEPVAAPEPEPEAVDPRPARVRAAKSDA